MSNNLARLLEPFAAEDVEWRVQRSGVTKDGKPWAMVLAYITSRAIMTRLDEVVGAENWCNDFRSGPDGGVMCGISIRTDGNGWVTKWDGAHNTEVEPVKGGLSSATKRAAVQWGIGRYLYGLSEGFADISDRGAYRAKAKGKDGKEVQFKWNPPALPAWALPANGQPAQKTATKAQTAKTAPKSKPAEKPAPAEPQRRELVGVERLADFEESMNKAILAFEKLGISREDLELHMGGLVGLVTQNGDVDALVTDAWGEGELAALKPLFRTVRGLSGKPNRATTLSELFHQPTSAFE